MRRVINCHFVLVAGRALRHLKGHEEAITALEGIDGGNGSVCLVASGSADRTIRIWDSRAKKAQVFLLRSLKQNT